MMGMDEECKEIVNIRDLSLRAGGESVLMGRADAAGQSAGALPCDLDEFFIRGDLVERGKQAFGLGEQLLGVVGFDLEEHVVDAKAVVMHGADEIGEIGFLARDALENIQELGGGLVERVVKSDFMRLGVLFVAESFLAEGGEAAVNVEVNALEIVEPAGKFEYFLDGGLADFEGLKAGLFVQLADIESARAGVGDLDLDEFGIAGFENFAERDGGSGGLGSDRGAEERWADGSGGRKNRGAEQD
jgi:hypothetical protein